jgi:hypothetical protein
VIYLYLLHFMHCLGSVTFICNDYPLYRGNKFDKPRRIRCLSDRLPEPGEGVEKTIAERPH